MDRRWRRYPGRTSQSPYLRALDEQQGRGKIILFCDHQVYGEEVSDRR